MPSITSMNLVLSLTITFLLAQGSSETSTTTVITTTSTNSTDATTPEPPSNFTLHEKHNSRQELSLSEGLNTKIQFQLQPDHDRPHNWEFSLHLTDFDRDNCTDNAAITIVANRKIDVWKCNDKEKKHILKGLKGTVELSKEGDWGKAKLVAELYFRNTGKGFCPDSYFNCQQAKCDFWSGGSYYQNEAVCIPLVLVHDKQATCCYLVHEGKECDESWDEHENNNKAHTCLFSASAIIVRSLIAIFFVMMPTLVIFIIFYRRQVNRHREQLIRERLHTRYSIAVIGANDLRYANDIPPTYEDIYDTKEPPPCFCEAVAVTPPSSPVLEVENTSPVSCSSCDNKEKIKEDV